MGRTRPGSFRAVVVSLAAFACLAGHAGAQVVADFTHSPVSGPADLTVQFSDQTSGSPSQWIWIFGDGTQAIGTQADVTHVYTEPGTYDVTLQVIGPGLQLDSLTKVGAVHVEPAVLVPGFDVSFTSGIVGDTVLATSTTTGTTSAVSTTWDFGDGTPPASGIATSHQYELPGTYSVSMTVAGAGSEETLTQVDLIHIAAVDLQAAFTPSTPVSGEVPLTVAFDYTGQGVSPTAYLWDFGGAAPPSPAPSATIECGLPGSYDVSLTVSYFGQQETLLVEDLLEVLPVPFAVAIEGTTPAAGPAPQLVSFTAAPVAGPAATNHIWDFGDGTTAVGPAASVSHLYREPGQYDVTLQASYFGQSHDAALTGGVHVGPPDTWQVAEFGPPVGAPSGLLLNVALDGERLALRDVQDGASRVRVHERDASGSWPLVADLEPDLGTAGAGFGSLALAGDILLVGEAQLQRPGRASVFERQADGAWLATATLTSLDPGVFQFGRTVALEGDRALIGATGLADGQGGAGRAYLFERQPDGGWIQAGRFVAPPGVAWFGRELALSGGRAIIGASGLVTTYVRAADGSWSKAPDLLSIPGVTSFAFGLRLAAHGERLAVLGFDTPEDLPRIGTYLWVDGAWEPGQILVPDDIPSTPTSCDLAMSATRLVFGNASGAPATGDGLLSVHDLLGNGEWDTGRRVVALDAVPGSGLGKEVCVDGDHLLALAPDHDHNPGGALGAAYLFQRVVQSDLGLGGPEGVQLALAGGDLTTPGSPATLSLTGAGPGAPVLLVLGLASFDPPLFAQGGLLLPVPDLLLSGLTSSAAGAAFLPVVGVRDAPAEVFVQAVVAGPRGSQFSNALGVTLGR